MQEFKIRSASEASEEAKNLQPKEYFTSIETITNEQYIAFKNLIDRNSSETQITEYFQQNKNVLANCLRDFNTGHHGAWLIPKQKLIVQEAIYEKECLIPDYLICGKNSDGFNWFVIELKGANGDLFNQKSSGTILSSTLSNAIIQTLQYIDICSKDQGFMRDGLKLEGFREPKGIIYIGRETEFDKNESKKQIKAAWNRLFSNIQIRTYDSLVHRLESVLQFRNQS